MLCWHVECKIQLLFHKRLLSRYPPLTAIEVVTPVKSQCKIARNNEGSSLYHNGHLINFTDQSWSVPCFQSRISVARFWINFSVLQLLRSYRAPRKFILKIYTEYFVVCPVELQGINNMLICSILSPYLSGLWWWTEYQCHNDHARVVFDHVDGGSRLIASENVDLPYFLEHGRIFSVTVKRPVIS